MKTLKILALITLLVLVISCTATEELNNDDTDVDSPSLEEEETQSDSNSDTQAEEDDAASETETEDSASDEDDQSAAEEEEEEIEVVPTSDPDCYTEGIHPIGESIADSFEEITTYEEVMVWFCNGALFEDILNALTTQELTGVEADEQLKMLVDGYTWDDIWLELGVTEE